MREIFSEFLHGKHRERKLYYYLASSSGKAVSEQVPALIGKRAGWASKQGASFIELAVENPSMILSDMEELKNTARQLGMSYSVHSSTNIGLGTSYLHAGGRGFVPAHDYYRKLIITCGKLKEEVERTTNGEQTLTSINAHSSINPTPPEEERLAQDVSVDPFGNDTREIPTPDSKEDVCKIYYNKKFREQFWIGYIRRKLLSSEPYSYGMSMVQEFDNVDEARREALPEAINNFIMNMPPENDIRKGWEEMTEEVGEITEIPTKDLQNILRQLNSVRPGARRRVEEAIFNRDEVREEMKKAFVENPRGFNVILNISRKFSDDDLMKESFVFRHMLPRWMPHAEESPVKEMWEKITDKSSGISPERAEGELEDLREELRGQERIVAASTAAMIWGQLTQIRGHSPGVDELGDDVTLVEILDYYGIQISNEAHMAGTAEEIRIWVPADRIALAEAINNTKVNGETHDVIRVTIDMEHLATHKVDPTWVIKGEESQNLRGLEGGEGKLIRTMHVTHPYIAEGGAGHQHGPIRRGDTLVFGYIYNLIDKGFAQRGDEPAIIMYEYGPEQAENIYNLRLILDMIEQGITPEDLEVKNISSLMDKEPENLKERLLQDFFGLSEQDMRHEWQTIHEHTLDPLEGMLQSPKGTHTWEGRAAMEKGTRPEEYKKEEYR